MKHRPYWLIIAIILGLTNIFISHEIIIRSAHVLYQKPEWVSAKSLIPNGLISAQEFFLERQTLAKDKLNLSEWNGPNEVHWNIDKAWNQLKLDVSLADKAYVWIFIAQDENRRYAFRLSRNEKYKSGFYEPMARRKKLQVVVALLFLSLSSRGPARRARGFALRSLAPLAPCPLRAQNPLDKQ